METRFVLVRPGGFVSTAAGAVANLAELRKTPGGDTTTEAATVLGHTTPGDGGDGAWRWDPASTLPDDDGTVVSAGGVGRWLRVIDDTYLNVLWFGAVGDGVHDDTVAVRRTVATAYARDFTRVFFPLPAVAYTLQPQGYTYGIFSPVWAGCVDLDPTKDMTLFGDRSRPTIRLRTPDGRSPDTNFVLACGVAVDQDNPAHFVPTLAPAWTSGHGYSAGAHVTAPNGHEYIATNTGTSGSTPPADLTPHTAGTIHDGSMIWALGDLCFRGNLFRIKSFALNADVVTGVVTFENLILDGQAPRDPTIEAIWPLAGSAIPSFTAPYDRPGIGPLGQDVAAGIGWNTPYGHHPIVMVAPYTYGKIVVRNCDLINWRSEVLYQSQGSSTAGPLIVEGGLIDSCAGNGISVSGPCQVDGLTIRRTSQAVENDNASYDQTFNHIHVADCGMGLTFPGNVASYTNRGKILVTDSVVERCSEAGLFISGYISNLTVLGMEVIDCGQLGGFPAVYLLGQLGGEPTNVELTDVHLIADLRGSNGGFNVNVGTGRHVRLVRPVISRTDRAVANGVFFGGAASGVLAASSDLVILDPDWRGANTEAVWVIGAGIPRIERARLDGLWSTLAPFLDPAYNDTYEFRPGAPATLSSPRRFPVGRPCRVTVNGNVTVANNANITLTLGVNYAPGGTGGTMVFLRTSAASENVVQLGLARNF